MRSEDRCHTRQRGKRRQWRSCNSLISPDCDEKVSEQDGQQRPDQGSKRFDTLKKQLTEIASALEAQAGIPAIAHQAVLIEEIQTDQWWEGITVPLLELVRLRLRDLVQHIEKPRKTIARARVRLGLED